MRKCSRCGKRSEKKNKFCPKCGFSFEIQTSTPVAPVAPTEENSGAIKIAEPSVNGESVSSQEREKENKTLKFRKIVAVAMPIYYGLLLVLSLVCLLTHALDGVFTNENEALRIDGEGQAYATAILLLIACLTPALALYYGAASPYKLKKSARVLLFVGGVIGLTIAAVIYIAVVSQYTEIYAQCNYVFGDELFGMKIDGDSFMFPVTLILGDVAFIVYYAMCLFGHKLKVGKKLSKITDKMQNDQPVVLIVVNVLLTVLLPVVSAILSAVIAFAIIALVAITLLSITQGFRNNGSTASGEGVWTLVDEHGSTRTLRDTGNVTYENGSQEKIFRDDIGYEWLSSDGKNFYRR
ncbi:MAG: zinc ribbon domain-containing protein [Clostridia bacterium]|nr:zinc ribbon domain-containing protein [Clostridia bacterium]